MNRIASLDVFRGLIIALMIIVNSQNTSSYSVLVHAAWHGCTLADIVFPSFLFIVGISLVISLNKHLNLESKKKIYYEINKRGVILFLLGIALNLFPHYEHFDSLRILGVLQRIALCYWICAYIYLNTSLKIHIALFLLIMLFYYSLMTQVAVPGTGINQLTTTGSWASYVDQWLFTSKHLLFKTYDPEGLLSTIPAIATTLVGVMIGQLLLCTLPNTKQCGLMLGLSIVFLIVGWLWGFYFPWNKSLWTSSFVFWTSGCSLAVFVCCFYLIDILGAAKWFWPFKVLGMNALFIFIFHVVLLKIQFNLRWGGQNAKEIISHYLFGCLYEANVVLLYSLAFLLLNFLVALFLYKKKIFIRV